MRWLKKDIDYSEQELILLKLIDRELNKDIYNELLKLVRISKEVRTLQDINIRKLLEMKLAGNISEDDGKILEHLLKCGVRPDTLTFDTLDLIYQIYK